jgi:hypothetical protein
MRKHITTLAVVLLLAGCARFSTTQKDIRNADGTTEVTTRASAYTLFSAKSDLARWKASQTEKTQGAEVGGLSQQGGTNTAATVAALAELLKAIQKP